MEDMGDAPLDFEEKKSRRNPIPVRPIRGFGDGLRFGELNGKIVYYDPSDTYAAAWKHGLPLNQVYETKIPEAESVIPTEKPAKKSLRITIPDNDLLDDPPPKKIPREDRPVQVTPRNWGRKNNKKKGHRLSYHQDILMKEKMIFEFRHPEEEQDGYYYDVLSGCSKICQYCGHYHYDDYSPYDDYSDYSDYTDYYDDWW